MLRVVKARFTSMHCHSTAKHADTNATTGGNSEDAALWLHINIVVHRRNNMNYHGNINEISGGQSLAALSYIFSYVGTKTLTDPFNLEISYAFVKNEEPLGNTAQINVGWSYAMKYSSYGNKNKLITSSWTYCGSLN